MIFSNELISNEKSILQNKYNKQILGRSNSNINSSNVNMNLFSGSIGANNIENNDFSENTKVIEQEEVDYSNIAKKIDQEKEEDSLSQLQSYISICLKEANKALKDNIKTENNDNMITNQSNCFNNISFNNENKNNLQGLNNDLKNLLNKN